MNEPLTLLVVDDDITNRMVLRALLKADGYQVFEAENGQQAVDTVSKKQIDIILMDVMMPVLDGYQAAQIIKSEIEYFIPIIFLTAITDEALLAKCLASGGDDVLTKPYSHVLLRAKIDSMNRIRILNRKIEQQNNELNKHNTRIQQEINVAKKVFANILNHDMRGSKSGLRYSMSPMSVFNGDVIFSDVNQSNGLDVLISDFTGHGLSAAISSIPMADIFYAMTRKGFSFKETLTEANNKLVKMLPTQMFMSAAFISVDRLNNVLSVVNAGLPDLYLIRDGEIIKTFKSKNLPLGIISVTADTFEMDMASLHYGDRLLAATDGIMEAENADGEFYGVARIIDSINSAENADSLFNKVLNDCMAFTHNAQQSDDITLIELHHKKDIDYENKNDVAVVNTPSNWSMQFSLDVDSLRKFDILPYIMQGVNGLQSIPNGRSTVQTILAEIFSNSLDHGVLSLDSSLKNDAGGYLQFYQQKTERLNSVEEGNIQITLSHEQRGDGGVLTIHVVDSGDGFDYTAMNESLESNTGLHGRGLPLIKTLCQDVCYMGKGNVVVATYAWGSEAISADS